MTMIEQNDRMRKNITQPYAPLTPPPLPKKRGGGGGGVSPRDPAVNA